MTTRRWIAGSAVAALLGPVAVSSAAPPVSAGCRQVVVAPNFATSRAAFCAAISTDGVTSALLLARTSDAGRSWQRVDASGIVPRGDDRVVTVIVSSEYATDHAVYVALNASGTFRSTDDGATFVPVDSNGIGIVAATRVVGEAPLPTVRRGVLLVAKYGATDAVAGSYAVDFPVPRIPVAGTPALDLAFAAAPGASTVLAFGADGAGATYQITAYACDATFSCVTRLGALPKRHQLDRVWVSPYFATDRSVVVRTLDTKFRQVFLQSSDGGRTFTTWKPLQRLVDEVYAAQSVPQSDVAWTRSGSKTRIVVRLADPARRAGGPPAERILSTSDGGATWRLLAYGRHSGAHRGTVPPSTQPGATVEPPGFLVATADRLFLAGVRGIYCSTDGGVRWTPHCVR